MPKPRFQPPERIIGAADLSKHPELRGSLKMVRRVKEKRRLWKGLREACNLEVNYARKRDPGHWELAVVAFVTSGQVDIEPWHDETTDELWRECGFDRKPSYPTTHRRLRELERCCEAFLDAAGLVIQRCREHDPRVFAHAHFDSTEDETHASLVHDCGRGDKCKRRSRAYALRAHTGLQREQREKRNEEDPVESVKRERAASPQKTMMVRRRGRRVKRVKIGGCWYVTRDVDAGIRAYAVNGRTRKFWHGYFSGKATCHLTGGVIPSVDSASTNEADLFPALFDRVTKMVGEAPQTAIGDRGYSIASCFEHATRNGTAPVFPWRRYGDGKQHDKLTHDRHGLMRCKHCGGPMTQTKFSAKQGSPRLWFQCLKLATDDCVKPQTITCNQDWRLLVPLAQSDELYVELKETHRIYEAAHDRWRDRYKVAADGLANRPKAVGLDWHRLRASVACFVDWLRIATINDWLRPVKAKAKDEARKLIAGERPLRAYSRKLAKDFADHRAEIGLGDHYGPQAKKLGLGDETPPSERGDPPDA